MSPIDVKAEPVRYAKGVKDLLCSLAADIARWISEPRIIRVSCHVQRTRCDHGIQLMVIVRQVRNSVARKLRHGVLKPIIIGVINIFHATRGLSMIVTPRIGATATRLLGNGQRDTLIKRSGEERQFAGIGAPGYGNMIQIYLIRAKSTIQLVQAINYTADTPSPRTVLSRIGRIKIRIKLVIRIRGLRVTVSRYLTFGVCNSCDIATGKHAGWKRTIRTIHPDTYRKGAAPRWKGDRASQREGVCAYSYLDCKCPISVAGGNL